MDVGREGHLRRVRLLVGERLHADDRLTLVDDLDPPVDPLLAAGGDLDGLRGDSSERLRARCRRAPGRPGPPSSVLRLLCTLAESTTSSFWTKNRGRLQPDEQVLGGDDLGLALADPAFPGPCVQALTFQVVRLSGSGNSTSAVPSASVVSAAAQKAVSAKLVRTTGWTAARRHRSAERVGGDDLALVLRRRSA